MKQKNSTEGKTKDVTHHATDTDKLSHTYLLLLVLAYGPVSSTTHKTGHSGLPKQDNFKDISFKTGFA